MKVFKAEVPFAVMSLEKWNSQTTIKFIREFQSEECLWNKKVSAYKSKPAREAAFKRIAEEMKIAGFGVPEAKNKMRILRSTYYQERKKIHNSLRSGTESSYVTNLPWYKEMENVLKNVDERRTTVENVSHNSSDSSVTENLNLPQDDTACESKQVHTKFPNATKVSKRKGIFRAIAELKTLQELINKDEPEEKEDQFDVFGKSVAMQLRALSYERGVIGQARIQNFLTELSTSEARSSETQIVQPSDNSTPIDGLPMHIGHQHESNTAHVSKRKCDLSDTVDEAILQYLENQKMLNVEQNLANDAVTEGLKKFLLSMLPDLEKMSDQGVRRFKRKALDAVDDILSS